MANLKCYGSGRVQWYLRVSHFLYRKVLTRKDVIARAFFKALSRIRSHRHGIEIPACIIGTMPRKGISEI